ncbi:hypothetical protein CC80DRAFT_544341 [Byssothecium circinans]|uniref:Uncharacterized protein n=1 Tax=Byssothecium circinans TaxID=147558 RepID=A0A6A5UDG1_9PLEO|nr:hypothetical protein CC80DRAFT_544341 [Byssothecium circinans]
MEAPTWPGVPSHFIVALESILHLDFANKAVADDTLGQFGFCTESESKIAGNATGHPWLPMRPSHEELAHFVESSPAQEYTAKLLKPPPSNPLQRPRLRTPLEWAHHFKSVRGVLLNSDIPDDFVTPIPTSIKLTPESDIMQRLSFPDQCNVWQELLVYGTAPPGEWMTRWQMVDLREAGDSVNCVMFDPSTTPLTGSYSGSELICLLALAYRQLQDLEADRGSKPHDRRIAMTVTTCTRNNVRLLQAYIDTNINADKTVIRIIKQAAIPYEKIVDDSPTAWENWLEVLSWTLAAPYLPSDDNMLRVSKPRTDEGNCGQHNLSSFDSESVSSTTSMETDRTESDSETAKSL